MLLAIVESGLKVQDAESKLRTALKEAEKVNDEQIQFLANISHKLKTPINVMLSALQMTNIIVESKQIELIFDTDVEEKITACDPSKIETIIFNLLSNAIKFTNADGKIIVNMFDRGEYIIISFKDSGTGISEENKQKIFERFMQVDGTLYRNKISVAQEHYATAVSQIAMSMLYERIFATPKNGKIFLGTCVQGELHEFGIRMICDYMESCGWNTYYLGANMSHSGIIQMVNEKKPDIIAISCAMISNIPKAQNLIQLIKSCGISTPVIVEGYPFNMDKGL